MPESKEFLLYPKPHEITSLPDDRVGPVIFELLEAQAIGTPDFERTMGLGQLARIKQVSDVESWIVRWLDAQPTAVRYDAAGLFLWGYWGEAEPSAPAIASLLSGLEGFADVPGTADSLAAALSSGFHLTRSQDIQRRIRDVFASLIARGHRFQPAVQKRVDHVLSVELD